MESELAASISKASDRLGQRIARSSEVTMTAALLELGEPKRVAEKAGGGAEALCPFVRAGLFLRVSTPP